MPPGCPKTTAFSVSVSLVTFKIMEIKFQGKGNLEIPFNIHNYSEMKFKCISAIFLKNNNYLKIKYNRDLNFKIDNESMKILLHLILF